jgi:MarR family transcriptional regulator, organic hydroperoxide resistance regulator
MGKPLTLDQHLCFSLYSASIAINRAYKPLLDGLGITYPQYLVLSTLWEEDGRTISAIAERLALEPSTVTPLVKRLESAGFVSRQRNKNDERQVLVTLTAKGEAMQEQSRCLGETLIASSGMTVADLGALNEAVKALRDAVTDRKPAA